MSGENEPMVGNLAAQIAAMDSSRVKLTCNTIFPFNVFGVAIRAAVSRGREIEWIFRDGLFVSRERSPIHYFAKRVAEMCKVTNESPYLRIEDRRFALAPRAFRRVIRSIGKALAVTTQANYQMA